MIQVGIFRCDRVAHVLDFYGNVICEHSPGVQDRDRNGDIVPRVLAAGERTVEDQDRLFLDSYSSVDVDGDRVFHTPGTQGVNPDFGIVHPVPGGSLDREGDGGGLPGPDFPDAIEIVAEDIDAISFEMDILDIHINVGDLCRAGRVG